MWDLLKHRIIAYRNAVTDEVAQDAYDVVLGDMAELEEKFAVSLSLGSEVSDRLGKGATLH